MNVFHNNNKKKESIRRRLNFFCYCKDWNLYWRQLFNYHESKFGIHRCVILPIHHPPRMLTKLVVNCIKYWMLSTAPAIDTKHSDSSPFNGYNVKITFTTLHDAFKLSKTIIDLENSIFFYTIRKNKNQST